MGDVICTVDVVLLTLRTAALHVLLHRREREPFQNVLALPGGYVHPHTDRDTRDAALRVLQDKLGIQSPYLEQLATFSGPARDPRGWSVSVAYYALVPENLIGNGKDCSGTTALCPVDDLRGLPFDHAQIVETAVHRVRNKSSYSSLPMHLCQAPFTLPQLQTVYEAVLGEPLNKVSFRRKMDELAVLEAIPGAFSSGNAHRPAQLYQLKPAWRHALSVTERGI
ncbi:NUDIX domain-containing protein [Chitiniphilus purpureus]|uniref:NUDIX domain-containing protein n=1 Tax=Chitiniphilus purpureus TaxID=2981137 RepID=A0ABY6DN21_9NEIS|nr:NUDIX domain-containing protein [Chitiniphilus sp. CD1]UXY15762.1 NUDIX domain-containing protein [Chitiniphilus sp. CD1]